MQAFVLNPCRFSNHPNIQRSSAAGLHSGYECIWVARSERTLPWSVIMNPDANTKIKDLNMFKTATGGGGPLVCIGHHGTIMPKRAEHDHISVYRTRDIQT